MTARERAALAPIKNIKWVGKPNPDASGMTLEKVMAAKAMMDRNWPTAEESEIAYISFMTECAKRLAARIKRKPVRRVSLKRAKELREYSKRRKVFLEEHQWCFICRERPSTEIHHIRGRIGEMLNQERYWISSCRTCHNWIHNNPSEAREKGLLA